MIDTNILLDWLLDRNVIHTERIDVLFSESKSLHIPDVIIVELAFALEKFYELPREMVFQNITKVLDESLFNCNRAVFYRALGGYKKHSSLSFLDCCLVHYADLQRSILWTFDKKLANQSSGKARLLS